MTVRSRADSPLRVQRLVDQARLFFQAEIFQSDNDDAPFARWKPVTWFSRHSLSRARVFLSHSFSQLNSSNSSCWTSCDFGGKWAWVPQLPTVELLPTTPKGRARVQSIFVGRAENVGFPESHLLTLCIVSNRTNCWKATKTRSKQFSWLEKNWEPSHAAPLFLLSFFRLLDSGLEPPNARATTVLCLCRSLCWGFLRPRKLPCYRLVQFRFRDIYREQQQELPSNFNNKPEVLIVEAEALSVVCFR